MRKASQNQNQIAQKTKVKIVVAFQQLFFQGACRLRRHRVLCFNLFPALKGFPRRPLAQE
jgi:hypothetical protein